MPESIQSHLKRLHELYCDALLDDPKAMRNYVWTVAKQLFLHAKVVDSLLCRQLLADCMKLQVERPSRLYSSLLLGAIKVARTYPEFRFTAFLNMWGIEHLRPEDYQHDVAKDGMTFPSLAERTAKTLGNSLLLYPVMTSSGPAPSAAEASPSRPILGAGGFEPFLAQFGFRVLPMLVTRIKQAVGKDGRKYRFVTLTSPDGLEVESISNNLQPSPLHPLPEGKHHYINIGQLYNCLLRVKQADSSQSYSLQSAVLSDAQAMGLFPTEVGYIEAIDPKSGLMHIYDRFSRHFVAHVLRFSREKVGDFVSFIPLVPQSSKFKTAVILGSVPTPEASPAGLVRAIRITAINSEKHYAAWELIDNSHPITEMLSPLQLSLGETSPAFTTGYFSLPQEAGASTPNTSPSAVPADAPSSLCSGQILRALVYLKRGKDRMKRPHVARLFS